MQLIKFILSLKSIKNAGSYTQIQENVKQLLVYFLIGS